MGSVFPVWPRLTETVGNHLENHSRANETGQRQDSLERFERGMLKTRGETRKSKHGKRDEVKTWFASVDRTRMENLTNCGGKHNGIDFSRLLLTPLLTLHPSPFSPPPFSLLPSPFSLLPSPSPFSLPLSLSPFPSPSPPPSPSPALLPADTTGYLSNVRACDSLSNAVTMDVNT